MMTLPRSRLHRNASIVSMPVTPCTPMELSRSFRSPSPATSLHTGHRHSHENLARRGGGAKGGIARASTAAFAPSRAVEPPAALWREDGPAGVRDGEHGVGHAAHEAREALNLAQGWTTTPAHIVSIPLHELREGECSSHYTTAVPPARQATVGACEYTLEGECSDHNGARGVQRGYSWKTQRRRHGERKSRGPRGGGRLGAEWGTVLPWNRVHD